MAAFNNLALTVNGLKALLAAQAGTTLTLSKIGMGSGSATNITGLTGLVTPEVMMPISATKIDSESGYLTVIAKMTNEDIEEGFYWRETGLFFEDSSGNDVLFAYACVNTEYDYVPAYSDQRYVKHVRIASIITDKADITVKEAEGLLYVDMLTFEEFKAEVESHLESVRDKNTLVSISKFLPQVTVQTDIRTLIHQVDSGVYAYTISHTPLITIPDVECADAIITWERQDNPNGYVYGTLSIVSMYHNDSSGNKSPAIMYTCSIYNDTEYTEWKRISGAEDGLRSGNTYGANDGVFSTSLAYTHGCWNKWVTVVGSNIDNAPHAGDIWAEVFTGGVPNRGFQFVFSCFESERSVWVRFMHDNVWSGWDEFTTSKGGTLTGDLGFQGGRGRIYYDLTSENIVLEATNNTEADTVFRRLCFTNSRGAVKNAFKWLEDSTGKTYQIFGQHNKPTGSYTGNGSETSRNIAIDGYGRTMIVYTTAYGAILVTAIGAYTFGSSPTFLAYGKCHYDGSNLVIASTDTHLNASGVTYEYQVL